MSLLENLELIEQRMEQSFLRNRFDTFNQLASERQVLLRKAQFSPEKESFFAVAREQSVRWVDRLGDRVQKARKQQVKSQSLGGYASRSGRSGRMMNRSF